MMPSKGCGSTSSNPCARAWWLDSASKIATKQVLANPTRLILLLRGLPAEGMNPKMAMLHVGTMPAR
jgi:hypothetical protein